jgi:hypothetical protein
VNRSSNISNQESIDQQYKQVEAFPGSGEKEVQFIIFTLRTLLFKSKTNQLLKNKIYIITHHMSKHSRIEIEAKLANGLENDTKQKES